MGHGALPIDIRRIAHPSPHDSSRLCIASTTRDQQGNVLSPLLRLVPATSIFSLPFCDWCPLRVYEPQAAPQLFWIG
eukprot:1192382-Prorocentrum_minimum.AAC.2